MEATIVSPQTTLSPDRSRQRAIQHGTAPGKAHLKKYTFTMGRPPWYSDAEDGRRLQSLVIGVAGGTASGKSSVCREIVSRLRVQWVAHLSLDYFYRSLLPTEDPKTYNFDHPEAFDWELVKETLRQLKEGKKVDVPTYDFKTHKRTNVTKTLYGADVILFEGILSFHEKDVRDLMDIKIFVDEDADIRLSRRIRRDIAERGRDVMGVIQQYERFVKPAHEDFVKPTMQWADLIIPKGIKNEVAINIICKHIELTLRERGFDPKLSRKLPHWTTIPANIHIMEQTEHLRALHTIIRDKATPLGDFVFFSNRLSRLVIEEVLNQLPVVYDEKVVSTPVPGQEYQGYDIRNITSKVAFISVMRAGEAMEEAVREVLIGAPIGKILIQSHGQKRPELFYYKMPRKLSECKVIVMDPMLATGESLKMAIRVILDHNVPEENILVATLIASPQGLHSLSYSFPKVQIVTSAMDTDLNEKFYIMPGIGNFGDRYFGTTTTSTA